MATVKLKDIAMPPHYLRAKIKASYVGELLTDLCLINGVKDWHELLPKKEKTEKTDKDGKPIFKTITPKLDWPFPPIEVARNEKLVLPTAEKGSKPSETKKKLKVSKKKYFPYELIDGVHRQAVARRLKMKEISATVKSITNPADRFLEQYKTNAGPRGIRLDKDDRDNAIRIMSRDFNVSQKKLVELTGLDQTSISRIIAAKQRKEGPRKPPTKKEESGDSSPFSENQSKPSASSEARMSVEGLLERLQICASDFPKLKSSFITLLDQVANEKGLTLLIERVAAILDILRIAYRKKFEKIENAEVKTA
jgi:hypothetical protein